MNYPALFTLAHDAVSRDADLSDCLRYRYSLRRWWDDSLPWCCWIMLNPSTADAAKDDPTIKRCIKFSQRWGCGGLFVVNLFAWRATDPRQLLSAADPVGPKNDWSIKTWAEQCQGPLVAAWGAGGRLCATGNDGVYDRRDRAVTRLLSGVRLQCLGTTKDGYPKHPLARGRQRIPDDQTLVPYEWKWGSPPDRRQP